jgi:hypothetical protein
MSLARGRLYRCQRARHTLTYVASRLLVTLCVLFTQHVKGDFLFRQRGKQIFYLHLPILFLLILPRRVRSTSVR